MYLQYHEEKELRFYTDPAFHAGADQLWWFDQLCQSGNDTGGQIDVKSL